MLCKLYDFVSPVILHCYAVIDYKLLVVPNDDHGKKTEFGFLYFFQGGRTTVIGNLFRPIYHLEQ